MDAAASPGGDHEVPAPAPVGREGRAASGDDAAVPGAPVGVQGGRLTGLDAARAHATLAAGLALCTVAFWFELRRALGGNSLSWAYVFEWPLFAMFAVYMWWNVLHGDRAVRKRRRPQRPKQSLDPKYEGMLEAWEAHQRELRASVAATEGGDGPGSAPGRGPEAPVED